MRDHRPSLWLLAALAAAPACNRDECDSGATRCAGPRVLDVCEGPCGEPGCSTKWATEACLEGACVEPSEGVAFCALGAALEPRCEGRDGYCNDQGQAVFCLHGYAFVATTCELGKTCIEVTPDAGLPVGACASVASVAP